MIIYLINKTREFLLSLFGRLYTKVAFVNDLSYKIEKDTIYFVGEDQNFWIAAFLCPCGCSEIIQLNLMASKRPNWKYKIHYFTQTITFYPSIHRIKGCKSHFLIRHGKIFWCK